MNCSLDNSPRQSSRVLVANSVLDLPQQRSGLPGNSESMMPSVLGSSDSNQIGDSVHISARPGPSLTMVFMRSGFAPGRVTGLRSNLTPGCQAQLIELITADSISRRGTCRPQLATLLSSNCTISTAGICACNW